MRNIASFRGSKRVVSPRWAVGRGLREGLGAQVGRAWAPAISMISRARAARMFHPTGVVLGGTCEAVPSATFGALGERLSGPVLVRCSQALWKGEVELFDVLGIALRFRQGNGGRLDACAVPGDQDLLLATIRSPLTMPFSPFTTRTNDFFANTYFGVAPFDVGEGRRVKLRLRAVDGIATEGSRRDDLLAAVAEGRARWVLEARPTLARGWHPIACVVFEEQVEVDQDALRFDPFHAGAGFVPVGFVHALRKATYAAGQAARPHARSAGA